MKLYLVQHGDAVPKDENPERPLSDKGRTDVQRMASFLARGGTRVARVVHSGKVRARDTGTLLSQVLGPNGVVEEAAGGLDPDDSPELLVDAIAGWTEDVMLVGHMPAMGKLISHLVAGNEDAEAVALVPGTVVCLEKAEDGWTWAVNWMVRPELLGS